MNREERQEYVIQLYKEGKTARQIAALMHMSFRDIGAITNKVKLQADRERGYIADEPKSPESMCVNIVYVLVHLQDTQLGRHGMILL